MQEGVCIAGIYEDRPVWVRPVKRSGSIVPADLMTADHRILRPLEAVEFEFMGAKGRRPHIEDWLTNFLVRPVVKERPTNEQREAVLARLVESTPDPVMLDKKRSLVLIEPDSVVVRVGMSYGGEGIDVRFSFSMAGTVYDGETLGRGYPCTDLRLRSWAGSIRTQRGYSDRQFREALGAKRVFLVMGLSREYQGKHWPMVVGVHTCPDFEGEIDLDSLR